MKTIEVKKTEKKQIVKKDLKQVNGGGLFWMWDDGCTGPAGSKYGC